MKTLASWFTQWKKKGYRMSRVRLNLLGIFTQKNTPLSIEDLASQLSRRRSKPNRSTLYREVDFLKNEGLLQEFNFDGTKRYELALLEHHHHLICRQCKKIEEIALDESWEKVERLIQVKTGFTIEAHNLDFHGLCKSCTTQTLIKI